MATQPIWAFITGFDAQGNPQFVDGQNNVIDSVPGEPNYTAFWDVRLVVVPEDYVANTIRSAQEVAASGFEVGSPEIVVNCPVVGEP